MVSLKKMQHQDEQKEIYFFDSYVSKNHDYNVFTEYGYNRILSEFQKMVKPLPKETVADFGCGTGAFTKKLGQFGLKCIGIDISPKSIEYARKKYPNFKFITANIEKTNLRSNSIDIVIFSGVLHHFQDFSATVKEAYRVLRKGGRVFSYDPNRRNPIFWLYRDRKSPIHSRKGLTDNERLLTAEEIYHVFRRAGFRNVVINAVFGVGFKDVKTGIAKLGLPVYNFAEMIFDKTPFARTYGSFLISKGKK